MGLLIHLPYSHFISRSAPCSICLFRIYLSIQSEQKKHSDGQFSRAQNQYSISICVGYLVFQTFTKKYLSLIFTKNTSNMNQISGRGVLFTLFSDWEWVNTSTLFLFLKTIEKMLRICTVLIYFFGVVDLKKNLIFWPRKVEYCLEYYIYLSVMGQYNHPPPPSKREPNTWKMSISSKLPLIKKINTVHNLITFSIVSTNKNVFCFVFV